MFLGKGVLKICSKSTGEHPCRSEISIKLLCNFIQIALRLRCSPVNLLHIFRKPFLNKRFGGLGKLNLSSTGLEGNAFCNDKSQAQKHRQGALIKWLFD